MYVKHSTTSLQQQRFHAYVIVQVDDLVEAAAGLISVIDDLRPLDADSFNAFYTIYKTIAAVPPADRCVDTESASSQSIHRCVPGRGAEAGEQIIMQAHHSAVQI